MRGRIDERPAGKGSEGSTELGWGAVGRIPAISDGAAMGRGRPAPGSL